MRILLFALLDTYESLVPALEEKGHTVKLINQHTGVGINLHYADSRSTSWAEEQVRSFKPEIVVNNFPALILNPSSDYVYFGNTRESANLELCKWETRQRAWECGFELPEVVLECNLHEMKKFPYTTFLKSKGHDMWCQAWKVTPDTNIKRQNEMIYQLSDRVAFPAYVERGMEFEVQVYCNFRICGDEYSITGIHALCGDVDNYKVFWREENVEPDWRKGCWIENLSAEHYNVFREKCESWLEYAVTLGGNYEGTIGSGITEDLKVFWFEQNSRLNTHEIFVGDADAWLDSFTKNTDEYFWNTQI